MNYHKTLVCLGLAAVLMLGMTATAAAAKPLHRPQPNRPQVVYVNGNHHYQPQHRPHYQPYHHHDRYCHCRHCHHGDALMINVGGVRIFLGK
jgi:hypothetical protein